MPQNMQSMMLMQMRAPAMAMNQRAQLQAMLNSMPPEQRQQFLMNMRSGGSLASMYGQPSMSGEWTFTSGEASLEDLNNFLSNFLCSLSLNVEIFAQLGQIVSRLRHKHLLFASSPKTGSSPQIFFVSTRHPHDWAPSWLILRIT